MKNIIITCVLLITNVFALSHYDISKKADEVMSGFEDSKALMTMTLINASGQKRVRQMKAISLELEGGDKSLMEFISPADVKGTKFLNYEHSLKDDEQWLYLPALKRVKRISSKNKSGSFMGSEFSYEDLSAFNIDKYTYKKEEAKIKSINGLDYYVVSRVPTSKNSGYTKQISLVNTKTFLTHQVDYYDRKKSLLKTAYFKDYKKISGVYRIGEIHMKNFQNNKESILVWTEQSIKNSLKEKDFNKRALKK